MSLIIRRVIGNSHGIILLYSVCHEALFLNPGKDKAYISNVQ